MSDRPPYCLVCDGESVHWFVRDPAARKEFMDAHPWAEAYSFASLDHARDWLTEHEFEWIAQVNHGRTQSQKRVKAG